MPKAKPFFRPTWRSTSKHSTPGMAESVSASARNSASAGDPAGWCSRNATVWRMRLGSIRPAGGLLDQPVAQAERGGMRAVLRVELEADVVDVRLDRLVRERQRLGDLLVDQPVRDQLEHFGLALGEREPEARRER